MKHALCLAALVAVLQPLSLMARIGETPGACAERYGLRLTTEKQKPGFWDQEERYEKNGIRLTIRFLKNEADELRAEYIEYKPIDAKSLPLSAVKINALLETVSTNWTELIPLPPLPPPPTNAVDTVKIMQRTSKVKIVSMEKTNGIEEKRRKKEVAEHKEKVDALNARNQEISQLKETFAKMAIPGTNVWTTTEAYAAGDPSSLTIISEAYKKAYIHQVASEKARAKKAEATPLSGF
jgi:hypothetical protein